MNTITVNQWQKDGERQFRSCEAMKLIGISNRTTWNKYLVSIGLSTGKHRPVLRMTDMIWVQVARRWVRPGSSKRTHPVFRFLRTQKKWSLEDFLAYLKIDLLTITNELRRMIDD